MSYSVQGLIKSFESNRYQDVVDVIDQTNFSALENPVVSKIVAASYFQLGEYSNSLSLLSEIESCFIEDVDYLSLYGACLRRNGELDLARLQFERALKINPTMPNLQNNFANLLIDIGELDEAERILSLLLEHDPSYLDAIANLERLSEKRKVLISKIDSESSGSSWSPGDPLLLAFAADQVHHKLVNKQKLKSANQSESKLSRSIPEVKDYQIASDQLKLAQQAIADKRYEFALKLCSQAKLSMADSSVIYECVSDAYIATSLFKEAEICILHAIQMGASSFKLFVNLVSLACLRGDYSLAQVYFEKASSVDSENATLHRLREQIAKGYQKPFRFDLHWSLPGDP